MKLKLLYPYLICGLGISHCISFLPGEMPADFSVSLSHYGGMLNQGSDLFLSEEICYYKKWQNQDRQLNLFQIPRADLQRIYQMLRENKADQISTRTEKVYDRGGLSLQFTAVKETYNKSDSGMSFIKPHWRSNWNTIIQELHTLQQNALTTGPGTRLKWIVSPGILPIRLRLLSGRHTIFNSHDISSAAALPHHIVLQPGRYNLKIELVLKDGNRISQELDLQIAAVQSVFKIALPNK